MDTPLTGFERFIEFMVPSFAEVVMLLGLVFLVEVFWRIRNELKGIKELLASYSGELKPEDQPVDGEQQNNRDRDPK